MNDLVIAGILASLAFVTACAPRDAVERSDTPAAGDTTASVGVERSHTLLITSAGMGPVRLGMTLEDARRTLPAATFERTSDGDGVALVDVTLGTDTTLVVYAGEDDRTQPVDWSRRIERIETFSPAFHTAEGVRPGTLVRDVERLLGATTEIMLSEIESRQYIEFERQPAFLTFRLSYAGVFSKGSRTTRRYEPGATILSIAIAKAPGA